MTAIVGGIYLIASGKSASGLAIILANLVALLTVFLVRQFRFGNGPDELSTGSSTDRS